MSGLILRYKQQQERDLKLQQQKTYFDQTECRKLTSRVESEISLGREINETLPHIVMTDCPEFKNFVKDYNTKKFIHITHRDYYVDCIRTHVDVNENLVTYKFFNQYRPYY
jgi:hypothetical protein